MGTTLYLAVEGTKVLDFQASGYQLEGFTPNPPESSSAESVNEEFNIFINLPAASRTAAIWAIEHIFNEAMDWIPGRDRVFLVYAVEAGEDEYRSRVIRGSIGAGPMLRKRWSDGNIKLTVKIERASFWEKTTAETLILRNLNTPSAGDTSARIFNHGDQVKPTSYYHVNNFIVEAANIKGSIPAPINLFIGNLAGGAFSRGFVGVEVSKSATPVDYTYGDDPSPTADSGCSGGGYIALSWSGTTETDILTLFMTEGAHYAKPNYFKLLMRLKDAFAYTDLRLRVKLKFSYGGVPSYAEVYRGDQVLLTPGYQVYDIGTLLLPPVGSSMPSGATGVQLIISAQRSTAGSHALNLDFLQFFGTDGWCNFYPTQDISGLGNTQMWLDFTKYPFSAGGGSSGSEALYGVDGPGLWITPGEENQFHLLIIRADKTHVVDDSYSISGTYYPRRSVL